MKDAHNPKTPASQTAPELPHTLVKEYGIGHRAVSAATSEDPTVSATESPEGDPLTSSATSSEVPESYEEDDKTIAAVDDILAKESDTLLAVADAKQDSTQPLKRRRSFWAVLGAPWAFWWRHKWLRWLTILLILGGIAGVAATPRTRYMALNAAGVRSSASVIILDDTTKLPLKKVTVDIDGQQSQTDKDGKAVLTGIRLGDHTLTVGRVAFAPMTRHITIGWGSNPLGNVLLTATGTQYTLQIADYVSGQPIAGAEASSGDISALSDQKGKLVLTVSDTNVTQLALTIAAGGYRNGNLTVKAGDATVPNVVLVPVRKEVFVAHEAGRYNLYSMDLDGANKKLLLAGTGVERNTMALVVSPDGSQAVLASTRDNISDKDGFLQAAISLVNTTTGVTTTIDHATGVQLVDWIGTKLVYRMTMPGVTATDPQRYKLISYDTASGTRTQLAAANQFNAILSAGGSIYYAVSSSDPAAQLGLFQIKPDGSGKVQLTHDETWTALRTTYGTLALQTPPGWFTYTLGSLQSAQSTAPASFTNYGFIEDAAGKQALWVDQRGGKGVLLVHDIAANADKTLQTQDGIAYPVRWLNDTTVVYRVSNGSETADYAASTLGGTARKITDVTAAFGYSQAF